MVAMLRAMERVARDILELSTMRNMRVFASICRLAASASNSEAESCVLSFEPSVMAMMVRMFLLLFELMKVSFALKEGIVQDQSITTNFTRIK